MKGKIVAIALAALMVLAASPALAKPDGMPNGNGRPDVMTEGDPYVDARGNARFMELQNKDTDWNAIEDDGRYGWIVYGEKMSEGNFDGELEVKGMEPNSWYLVTLYSDDTDTGDLLGAVGYYGKVPKDNWADIALFQTDEDGEAEIRLPYTSPALDPVHEALIAPTLPAGDYHNVTVAVKYVGTGGTPNWTLVASGGYSVGGTPDARDYNIYEMAMLDFSIWGTPQLTTVLVKKDYTDPAWPLDYNGLMDTYGELRYWEAGEGFSFEFTGYQLDDNTDYSLIYYADPWPGNNPGVLIDEGTTDDDGYLHLEGDVELNMDLPHADDANFPTGAK
ncbi:MAG: hypothetical protein ACP5EK_04340, partial [Thermoplasmatota archaeon]